MDFLRPTSGGIKILNLDSRQNSVELKEKIGYLSDTSRFYDHWTAGKHIAFQEGLRGKSKNLNELVETFGLNQKLKFSNLSSGNKRKLAIILALMNDPEVLILDEPTSSLDPILQNAFHAYLEKLAKSGKTVFLSSHNLSEVEKICDRVGIIRDGKMVAVEKIADMKLTKMYDVNFRSDNVDLKDFTSENIKVASHVEGLITLKVKGDINLVVEKLSKIKVKDLEIMHVSLEDIFMEFYQSPSEALGKENKR